MSDLVVLVLALALALLYAGHRRQPVCVVQLQQTDPYLQEGYPQECYQPFA